MHGLYVAALMPSWLFSGEDRFLKRPRDPPNDFAPGEENEFSCLLVAEQAKYEAAE